MAKKSERKRLTKRLDDLCREIVRIRDRNTCQRCGKHITGHDSHPCHIIPKGKGASLRRFDLLNIFLGCFHCHRWWHDNPIDATAWFTKFASHRLAYLSIYRNGKPAKITTPEMRELAETLKAKLTELKGEQA
jgi:hypothetical protein